MFVPSYEPSIKAPFNKNFSAIVVQAYSLQIKEDEVSLPPTQEATIIGLHLLQAQLYAPLKHCN